MVKHILRHLLIIIPLVFPALLYAEKPTEPKLEFMLDWKPLTDGSVAIEFEGLSFRHQVINNRAIKHCRSFEINDDGTITLRTHIGNNVYEYLIVGLPEFFRIGNNDWEWLDKRTSQAYAER